MNELQFSTWNHTQRKLKSFVFRQTKDVALTEDIVQDVFLKVYTKADKLKDKQKFTAWIFQITRNLLADHFRSQSKMIDTSNLQDANETNPLNECASYCLQDILNNLPNKYREAIQLSELQGISQIELAQKLNISYSGAKSRVQRAKRMLKEKMDTEYLIEMDKYGNVITCENKVPCSCPEPNTSSCN